MKESFILKILDPQSDLELFKEAWLWRSHKRHVGAREATFEDVIADDPRQITIGVFNGQFCALFLLYEDEPAKFSAHFTSKRGTSRETLIDAGLEIRDAFMENGAKELCAWITRRNLALKAYLESLEFVPTESCSLMTQSSGQDSDTSYTLLPVKTFVKYAYRK